MFNNNHKKHNSINLAELKSLTEALQHKLDCKIQAKQEIINNYHNKKTKSSKVDTYAIQPEIDAKLTKTQQSYDTHSQSDENLNID